MHRCSRHRMGRALPARLRRNSDWLGEEYAVGVWAWWAPREGTSVSGADMMPRAAPRHVGAATERSRIPARLL